MRAFAAGSARGGRGAACWTTRLPRHNGAQRPHVTDPTRPLLPFPCPAPPPPSPTSLRQRPPLSSHAAERLLARRALHPHPPTHPEPTPADPPRRHELRPAPPCPAPPCPAPPRHPPPQPSTPVGSHAALATEPTPQGDVGLETRGAPRRNRRARPKFQHPAPPCKGRGGRADSRRWRRGEYKASVTPSAPHLTPYMLPRPASSQPRATNNTSTPKRAVNCSNAPPP